MNARPDDLIDPENPTMPAKRPAPASHDLDALHEHLDGRLHLDEMISRRIALEQVNEAFAEMRRGEVARSVIVFE